MRSGAVTDGPARDVHRSRSKCREDVRRQRNDRSEERRATLPQRIKPFHGAHVRREKETPPSPRELAARGGKKPKNPLLLPRRRWGGEGAPHLFQGPGKGVPANVRLRRVRIRHLPRI